MTAPQDAPAGGNLRRIGGGIMARERAAWKAGCFLPLCHEPAAGVVETPVSGPRGICRRHIPGAEERGYIVRTEPLS